MKYLLFNIFTVVSLAFAMKAPLISVADAYDFRLFSNKPIGGDESLLKSSQGFHIAAVTVFSIATVLGALALAPSDGMAVRENMKSAQGAVSLVGASLHACAVGTLLTFIVNLKNKVDRLPVPTDPDTWNVHLRSGGYSEIISFVLALASGGLAVQAIISARRRASYSQI
mgnify:CR=1 FL=1